MLIYAKCNQRTLTTLYCESAIISVDENRSFDAIIENRLVAEEDSSATSLSALKCSRANMTAFLCLSKTTIYSQAQPVLARDER